jgi:hypothetical protein
MGHHVIAYVLGLAVIAIGLGVFIWALPPSDR